MQTNQRRTRKNPLTPQHTLRASRLHNVSHAFTLIEVIVALVILGILSAMGAQFLTNSNATLITARGAVQESEDVNMCMNKLRAKYDEERISGKAFVSNVFTIETKAKEECKDATLDFSFLKVEKWTKTDMPIGMIIGTIKKGNAEQTYVFGY